MKKYLFFILPALLCINPAIAFPADTTYYFSEHGKLLWRNDNAMKSTSYVVKTSKQFHEIFHEIPQDDTTVDITTSYNPATVLSISRRTSRKVERLLRHGAVNDPLVTDNIVEVLDKGILRKMYDNIQSRCSTSDARNFKEHGGVLLPDGTITCITGDISDPRWFAGATLFIKQKALVYYHSHPDGIIERPQTSDWSNSYNSNKVVFTQISQTQLISYVQGPSRQDQEAVGEGTGYVFGMKRNGGTIYIYDKEGVKATLPVAFVKTMKKTAVQRIKKSATYFAGLMPVLQLPYLF